MKKNDKTMNDEDKKFSGTVRLTDSRGREWPCRLTLGALRRYKQETGEDASQLKGESSLGVLLWCCVKSSCLADGVPMDVGLEEFLDCLDVGALERFSSAFLTEKKMPPVAVTT